MTQPQKTIIENLRGFLAKRPFQVFAVVTSSSERYVVSNHDHLLFSPDGRTLFIFGSSGGLAAMVQSDHVTALEPRKRTKAA